MTVYPDKPMALTTDAEGVAEGAEYVVNTSKVFCMTYFQSATLIFHILNCCVAYGECRHL